VPIPSVTIRTAVARGCGPCLGPRRGAAALRGRRQEWSRSPDGRGRVGRSRCLSPLRGRGATFPGVDPGTVVRAAGRPPGSGCPAGKRTGEGVLAPGVVRPGGRSQATGPGCEGPGFDRPPRPGYRGQLCPGCPGPAPVRGASGWPESGLQRHGLPVTGVCLSAMRSTWWPEGSGAESRGVADLVRQHWAGPGKGDTPDLVGRTMTDDPDGMRDRHHEHEQQRTTVHSTTQRR
jgi:hypothetical protein